MSYPSSARRRPARPSLQEADDAYERRIIPFDPAARRRVPSEAYDAPYRSRSAQDRAVDAPARPIARPSRQPSSSQALPTQDRRARRRRRPNSWLQRNAFYVATAGMACGVLGILFGVAQVLHLGLPGQQPPAPAATASVSQTQPVAADPAAASQPDVLPMNALPTQPAAQGEITSTVQAITPNYTVAQGDSLVAIAARFNTTVARIQALNDLPDPRRLSIGQKLVIPPPL